MYDWKAFRDLSTCYWFFGTLKSTKTLKSLGLGNHVWLTILKKKKIKKFLKEQTVVGWPWDAAVKVKGVERVD